MEHFLFQPGLILLASGSVTGITLLATLYSIYSELIEMPSQLMRPKAAKAGKKIMLEKIPLEHGMTVEEKAEEICKNRFGITELETYYDDWIER